MAHVFETKSKINFREFHSLCVAKINSKNASKMIGHAGNMDGTNCANYVQERGFMTRNIFLFGKVPTLCLQDKYKA